MKMINDCSKVLHEMLLERIMLQQDSIQFLLKKRLWIVHFQIQQTPLMKTMIKRSKVEDLQKAIACVRRVVSKTQEPSVSAKDQTNLLIKSTKLSKSQVQNWYVSNN